MNEALMIKNLSKSYEGKKVIDNFSFSVKNGTVFGLLGANGAGKSTTIECILGTKKVDSGEVSVLGLNPIKDRQELFEQVGVQFQEAHYQENIKVGELCEMTASLYKKHVIGIDCSLNLVLKIGVIHLLKNYLEVKGSGCL